MKRTAEARRMAKALADELKSAGDEVGHTLVWSAAEEAIIEQICVETDRKVHLLALYEEAEDPALMVKLSAEVRLLEGSIARQLRQVKTELPAAESSTTVKARQAAQSRWGGKGA